MYPDDYDGILTGDVARPRGQAKGLRTRLLFVAMLLRQVVKADIFLLSFCILCFPLFHILLLLKIVA